MGNEKSNQIIKKNQIFTIPNILTYLRILSVPFFIYFYIVYNKAGKALTLPIVLFLASEFTDIIDGWIARTFNQISDIGKMLDPVADKLLQVVTILLLTFARPMHIHWIFFTIIAIKEISMIIGGVFLLKNKVVVQANKWGKIAGVFLAAGILTGFFSQYQNALRPIDIINIVVMSIGTLVTLYAGYQYGVTALKSYKISKDTDEIVYLTDVANKEKENK